MGWTRGGFFILLLLFWWLFRFVSETSGQKSVFIRGDSEATPSVGDITLCSVEELVLQHYIENGYSHGLHAEGSTIWSIIGAWNQILSIHLNVVLNIPRGHLSLVWIFTSSFASDPIVAELDLSMINRIILTLFQLDVQRWNRIYSKLSSALGLSIIWNHNRT